MIRHTRQEAKALGLPRCYGSVCAKHPELEGERYTSGSCTKCSTDRNEKYRAANPEKTRQHRIKSQEKTAEKRRNDLAAKTKKLEADRLYRLANKESIAKMKKAWYDAHPGRATELAVKRKKAVKLRTPKWLISDDWFIIKEAYELAALRTKMFGFYWEVDHVLPLQGKMVSGLHVPANLQVIPATLNRQKNNRYEVAF
jgi:hypothetical protein